jgi:CDP-paratose 2-epimerase
VLHIDDLYELICLQIEGRGKRAVYNVGGGVAGSVSLREVTGHCQRRAGRTIDIGQAAETRPADIPWYVTDHQAVTAETGWRPRRAPDVLFDDIFAWLREHEEQLRPILAA